MKKFKVYTKVDGDTRIYEVDHDSHESAISFVREAIEGEAHGVILAIEVA